MAERAPAAASVTSFDVARLAGVSRSAVSRAFTPGTSISEKTRKKVYQAASELGYRVNLVARGLNKQRTDLVGIIASRMANPHRAAQIDALAKNLLREGFRPMLFSIDDGMNTEQLISILLNYRVSGIVITSDAPPAKICEECARMRVPLVLMDRGDVLPFVDHVGGDNSKGGRLVADALIAAGRRNLLVLKRKKPVYSVNSRITAFVARAAERGLDVEILPVDDYDYDSGLAAAPDVARHRARGAGVFCPTDFTALGLLDGLRSRHHVRIPEEISLIGYDDIPQAAWEFAQMTTIRQPTDEFAKVVADLLKARIKTPDAPPINRILDVALVRRASV